MKTLSLNVLLSEGLLGASGGDKYNIEDVLSDLRKHLEQAKKNGYNVIGFGPSGDYFKDHVHT